MFKVLIVEDELLVRVGLKTSIQWTKFDMEVIADATNGEAALEIYEREAPDLILTDIKMPVMDGMELITRIRQKDSKTKIVILSCLEEFEYARKAMALNVSGYILKLTMTTEEMQAVLSKVHEELQAQKAPGPGYPGRKTELAVVREKLLKDYIFYGLYSEAEFERMMSETGWKVRPDGLVLCVLQIGRYARLKEKFRDERGQLLQFTVLNVFNEILENHQAGEAFHDTGDRYILLLNASTPENRAAVREKLTAVFENIEKVLSTYFDSPVYISSSSPFNGFAGLRRMYDVNVTQLNNRFFYEGTFFFLNDTIPQKHESQWKALLQKTAESWMLLGDMRKKSLEDQISRIIRDCPLEEQSLKLQLVQLTKWADDILQLSAAERPADAAQASETLQNAESAAEAVQLACSYLEEAAKARLKLRSVSKEVADAVAFLCSHYDQELSLNEISDAVKLSPGYLSNLFKREMNRNLIEYLTEYRIEKAKELLSGSSLKSYEIAEKVGFTDHGYFSRTFKKVTGKRPNEFRKKQILDRRED